MAMVQLLVDGGIGLILIISGIIMNMISKRNNKQCTKSVEGYVISYSFTGESRMHPIVEYVVDGITYNTKKKYKGIKSIKASGIPLPVKSKAYEDEKGYLHIKSGAIVNVRQMAEKLWPIVFFLMQLYKSVAFNLHACVLVESHISLYIKNRTVWFLYGGRLFVKYTNRCVCLCWQVSVLEHLFLCSK